MSGNLFEANGAFYNPFELAKLNIVRNGCPKIAFVRLPPCDRHLLGTRVVRIMFAGVVLERRFPPIGRVSWPKERSVWL